MHAWATRHSPAPGWLTAGCSCHFPCCRRPLAWCPAKPRRTDRHEDRQALGQVTCPGQVYCLLCKMTNRKQLPAPQSPSDKAQDKLRGQCTQVGWGNLRGRKLHEGGRKELCIDGPVSHETQTPDLHLFHSMILGKSLRLSMPQFPHL